MSKNGYRLRPVLFGYQACIDFEREYHSFVGETASGRWTIGRNRHIL